MGLTINLSGITEPGKLIFFCGSKQHQQLSGISAQWFANERGTFPQIKRLTHGGQGETGGDGAVADVEGALGVGDAPEVAAELRHEGGQAPGVGRGHGVGLERWGGGGMGRASETHPEWNCSQSNVLGVGFS